MSADYESGHTSYAIQRQASGRWLHVTSSATEDIGRNGLRRLRLEMPDENLRLVRIHRVTKTTVLDEVTA